MWKLFLVGILFSGNVLAQSGDATVDLINQLTSDNNQQRSRPVQQNPEPDRKNNRLGSPCGYRPLMNLPYGCQLVCISGEWQQVCQ